MNLLEKCEKLVEIADMGYYNQSVNALLIETAPSVCRALLEAMEEIDAEAFAKNDDCVKRPEGYTDGFVDGVIMANAIIRKHLEVEEE